MSVISRIRAALAVERARVDELLAELEAQPAPGADAHPPERTFASDVPEYLTTREAAALLGVTAKHLEGLRRRHTGPRCVRIGRSVRYPRDALLRFADA